MSGTECAPLLRGIGPGGTNPIGPSPLVESPPPLTGWHAAQRPTNVGDNSSGPRKRPAGACATPQPYYLPHLTSPTPSRQNTSLAVQHTQCTPQVTSLRDNGKTPPMDKALRPRNVMCGDYLGLSCPRQILLVLLDKLHH